jgi:hypothetical protein
MIKPSDWISGKVKDVDDIQKIYRLFEVFKKETKSAAGLDTFKRSVRRAYYYRHGSPAESEVKVMKDAQGPNLNIVTQSSSIRTLDELLAYTGVDMGAWEVQRHVVNSWGSEANENFQVKAWLKLREDSLNEREAILALMEEAKKYSPKYPKIPKSQISKSGLLFELSMFDHHFGQLSWAEETRGQHYDVKIAEELALDAVRYELSRIKDVKPERILLPIGNDFFNVNSRDDTTVHGTRQAEDDRWQKTFVAGRRLWVKIIEMCLQIAPVDVIIILGNHDAERSFYLGDALECWFYNAPDVTVDNSPVLRKYYRWGKSLLGFTHGSEERKGKGVLINLMAVEKPQDWADTKYREWHKGHLHAASSLAFQVLDEDLGVRELVLPSLVALDDYHAGKGYSHLRETTGMLWDKEKGKIDTYAYHP